MPYRPVSSRGHLGDRDDRGMRLVVDVDELADGRPVGDDDVIGQDHGERFVTDQLLGHEHGVAEPELLLLAHVGDLGQVADVADPAEHLDVATLLEQVLELVRDVEVILDRALLARGHDDDLLDAGGDGLLDRVLDHRLVDEREHLLRLGLGRREKSGSPTGGGKDGFSDSHRTSGAALVDRPSIARGPRQTRPGRARWGIELRPPGGPGVASVGRHFGARLGPGGAQTDMGERDPDLAEDLGRDEEAGEQEDDPERACRAGSSRSIPNRLRLSVTAGIRPPRAIRVVAGTRLFIRPRQERADGDRASTRRSSR